MDEQKLSEAFRAAAAAPPPASFDADDVRGASRRLTRRRRTQWASGSALGVLVLAGGVAFGTGGLSGGSLTPPLADQGTSTAQPHGLSPQTRGAPNPNMSPGMSPQDRSGHLGTTPGPGPGVTPSGCGAVDRELAAALTAELPAIAGSTPVPANGPCPADARAVAFGVHDGSAAGILTVVLVPTPNTGRAGPDAGPAAIRPTAHGGTITVSSSPAGGSAPPFAVDLDRVAADLAARG